MQARAHRGILGHEASAVVDALLHDLRVLALHAAPLLLEVLAVLAEDLAGRAARR